MRSRTGCQTCRQRKLKCDEKKPACGQCLKASKECVPSSGMVFRHQHNPSLNGSGDGDEDALGGFFAYKDTFDKRNVWVDVPKQVTFINTVNPYEKLDTPTPEYVDSPIELHSSAEQHHNTPPTASTNNVGLFSTPNRGLEALSAAAAGEHLPLDPLSIRPDTRNPDDDSMFSEPDRRSSLPGLTPMRSAVENPLSPPVSVTSPSDNVTFLPGSSPVNSPPVGGSVWSPLDHQDNPFNGRRLRSNVADNPFNGRRLRSNVADNPFRSAESLEKEHEIAYLLRYFCEGPGLWMDLFDFGTYFSSYVPVKALSKPLLKWAAVAYAAKALGRTHGRRPLVGENASRRARGELYPDAQSVDWYRKGAEYYDHAVSLLRIALQDDSDGPRPSDHGATISPDPADAVRSISGAKKRRVSNALICRNSSEELLAATAILCVYEFLDVSVPEWSRHLSGAKTLIDIAKDGIMSLQNPPIGEPSPPRQSAISKARRAAFWNLARQDMLAAFINESHTRLDTEDLPMWREAGLLIDANGFIQPSNATVSGYPEGDGAMREDMISNALIWLLSKLVNFMAAGDELPLGLGYPSQGVPQRTLLDYWLYLREQFDVWYEGLPLTFKPCARIAPAAVPPPLIDDEGDTLLAEVWYSIGMCASTMQSYHMSQIQLLMNKPHETTQGRSNIFTRFSSYGSVIALSQAHSREIVSIALSRPEASVRVHSVQPLYTAGQCLTDPKERRLILKLLRDIEADTGWATAYRVEQLLRQWD